MRPFIRFGAVAVATIMLAACASEYLEKAEQTAPGGSPFNIRLYAGYLGLAQEEDAEQDYADSDAFALRAIDAAAGKQVNPEEIASRKLPAGAIAALTQARARLMTALDGNARQRAADDAADAQVMFDCWMQEQEENIQPNDIKKCRDGFLAAIGNVEKRLAAPPRRAAAPPPPAPAPAPAPARAAAPPAPPPLTFVVHFGFNSTALSAEADRTIAAAAAAYRSRGRATVMVTGHADRSGASLNNLGLSLRRAQAVQRAMTGAGVPETVSAVRARGESEPRVATADGAREAQNRRVEIVIR